jgi:putative acetyltransferase
VKLNNAACITVDDLSGPEIASFLAEHIDEMRAVSPPGSKHALDLAGLRQPEITLWTLRYEGIIAGCGALKQLDPHHGEVKSMRTAAPFRRCGVAASLLNHLINAAIARGYRRVSLETGAMDFFAPARALYQRFGFTPCDPFGAYREDQNSMFFTKILPASVSN